ncbi:MAG: tetratricopeptide repeat protein [Candidatus Thorarchaeota archaeon]
MSDWDAREAYLQGRALEKKGLKMEALQKYEEAVKLDPESDKAWFQKFKVHYELGQIDEASVCAERAETINPEWARFIKKVKAKDPQQQRRKSSGIGFPGSPPFPGAIPGSLLSRFVTGLLGDMRSEAVTIDGRAVEGGLLISGAIGVVTKDMDGLGPQTVVDPDTGEEWVLERNGKDIIIHSHTRPIRGRIRGRKNQAQSRDVRLRDALLRLMGYQKHLI